MHLFLAYKDAENRWLLDEKESHHAIHVLRLKNSDVIHFTDGKGLLYKGQIITDKKKIFIQNPEVLRKENPPHPYVHIAIAPTKQFSRIEWFIEKATEAGVNKITLVHTHRTLKSSFSKERCLQIIQSACKQSLRPVLPEFSIIKDFREFVKNNLPDNKTFCAAMHISGKKLESSLAHYNKYVFIIGPEGDFTEDEIQLIKQYNYALISLGSHRLRTETAGLAALMNVRLFIGE